MNKAFEKIFEKLEEELRKSEERYHRYLDDSNLPCMFDKSDIEEKRVDTIKEMLEIVQEVSEEYKGGWIPCSERLPEAGKRYLVSAIWKDKDFEKSAVYDAVYGSDGLWHSYNYEPVSYKVIAWKPLPEPFKERD